MVFRDRAGLLKSSREIIPAVRSRWSVPAYAFRRGSNGTQAVVTRLSLSASVRLPCARADPWPVFPGSRAPRAGGPFSRSIVLAISSAAAQSSFRVLCTPFRGAVWEV